MRLLLILTILLSSVYAVNFSFAEELDQNKKKTADGKKIFLSKYDVSEDIKSIEVYVSYFFKLKFKILVNGNIIHQD